MSKAEYKYDWPLIGNRKIINYLEKCIAGGQLAGAYIFHGPDNLGKTTVANSFAQILLCEKSENKNLRLPCHECAVCRRFDAAYNSRLKAQTEEDLPPHSDFHIIKKAKDKKNISIEQVRDFIKILSLTSFLNSYKIGIIKHADKLSVEASNALLKTLEEPREKVIIILVTSQIETLPQTIVSRSQVLYFQPVSMEVIYDYLISEHKASRSEAKQLSSLSLGRPALAVKFLEDRDFLEDYKKKADLFISFWQTDINGRLSEIAPMFNKKLSGQEAAIRAMRTIEIWQGLARDLLLIDNNHHNLVQHYYAHKELERIKARINRSRVVKLLHILTEGKQYLQSNVNPRLVLENISIQI